LFLGFRSDGAQPHLVNIQFQKKVKLQVCEMHIAISNFRLLPNFFFFFFFFFVYLVFIGLFLFLKLVVLYVDFKLDESYTPSKISIRSGDGFHNLKVSSLVLDYVNNL